MKRLLCSLFVLAVVIVARAVTATIYVQAEKSPYLYCWYMVDTVPNQPLGTWPGTKMIETEVIKDVVFWKIPISTSDDITSFNIIFNDGGRGQTEDILGLSSDRYFTYDGYSGYTDISEEYGRVPNAEISQVEIRGDFNGWKEGGSSIMTKGEGYTYTMQIDLGGIESDQQFKLVVNGSVYGGIENSVKIDAPNGWVYAYGAGTIEEPGYLILRNSISDYKSYILTATWEENPNAIEGWTLKVEGKDYQYELICAEEWQILKEFYASTDQGTGWSKPWDFSVETYSVKTLPGVTANDGHVVGINLSNNQVAGTFPFALLSLPQLKSLNLSGNHLAGDLGTMTYAFAQKNPTIMTHLQELNISDNRLSGNIGVFAHFCPNLESLNASDNNISDVIPMIAPEVSVDLSGQSLPLVGDLHLADISPEALAQTLPSVLFYNHEAQVYNDELFVACSQVEPELVGEDSWYVVLDYANGETDIPFVSEQNVYNGQSGDVLYMETLDGTTFSVHLFFDEGDANFDGQVDVLDLQTDINYIFEDYKGRAFNFTAANLWNDELINVQDVICQVNLLMSMPSTDAEPEDARQQNRSKAAATEASLFVESEKLILSTECPVAAFDILIKGVSELTVSKAIEQMGFTCVQRKVADGVRLIGYSLGNAVIPAGDWQIASQTNTPVVSVEKAMLSDAEANAISVRWNSTPTGIKENRADKADKPVIYDLQGRKVNDRMSKGLYIQNGHKVVK